MWVYRISYYLNLSTLENLTVIKPKLTLVALLSTSAIATGILLSAVSPAKSCMFGKSAYYQQRYEQASWLRSPLAVVITLPGLAIAAALSVGNRYYNKG